MRYRAGGCEDQAQSLLALLQEFNLALDQQPVSSAQDFVTARSQLDPPAPENAEEVEVERLAQLALGDGFAIQRRSRENTGKATKASAKQLFAVLP